VHSVFAVHREFRRLVLPASIFAVLAFYFPETLKPSISSLKINQRVSLKI
jgi:hypothetical protein